MSSKRTDEQKLNALIDALGESVLEETDEELLEDLRMKGIDVLAESARIKAMLQSTVKTFRQRALEAARAAYQRQIERMDKQQYSIPETPAERRKLFSFLTKQSPFAEFVTAQYRDLEGLTDNDIETYLEDLAELGILEKFKADESDGKE
jgi:hypothetical protein